MQEFLALPTASKEKRYENIMGQLHVGSQKPLPQKGDHYRSYQTTGEGVICTTGIITKCTGNSTHPYEVTCTGADIRGYVGKTVAVPAVELIERTTKTENKPTQEEEKLLNCEVHTDFGEFGMHKGYIADINPPGAKTKETFSLADEEKTQIDIIYEDQDVVTTTIVDTIQKRSFGKEESTDTTENQDFELVPIQIRPRKRAGGKYNWRKTNENRTRIIVSPMGIQLETATENQEAKKRGRKARPRAAKTGSQKKNKKQNTPEKGICRTAFTEPSIFKHRAVFTGKRRQGERVAPGLGPGPAGGLKER